MDAFEDFIIPCDPNTPRSQNDYVHEEMNIKLIFDIEPACPLSLLFLLLATFHLLLSLFSLNQVPDLEPV
jgi:hypothetical protein